MATIEQRIMALENRTISEKIYTPLTRAHFYGREPLPADYYSRPPAHRPRTLAEFYCDSEGQAAGSE